MGKIKYLKNVRAFFEKTPVVSSNDIKMLAKGRYRYLLISNMMKRGEIKKITKGFYTLHDDPAIAVFCFRPSYIGLQEALSIHGLWEQETSVVIITAKKIKKQVRNILGSNMVFHRLKPKYIFGYILVKYGDFYVLVSDIEKTLIDLIYFGEIPDRHVLGRLKKRADAKKLREYLRAYPKTVRHRILLHAG